MKKEFKNTIWSFALNLLGIDLMAMLIFYLAVISLVGISEHEAWQWAVTGISTLILWGLVWMVSASRGKKDVDNDALYEKRKAINPNLMVDKYYEGWKGFVAGIMAKTPAIILLIVHLFIKDNGITDMILRLYFGVHFKAISLWGPAPLAIVSYILLFSVVCGLAYRTGPAQRQKVLTIIKRNQEKQLK